MIMWMWWTIITPIVLVTATTPWRKPKNYIPRDCFVANPVCGEDENTYDNSCIAELLVGVEVRCDQECPCPLPCDCDPMDGPICDRKGNLHPNRCLARCNGFNLAGPPVCRTRRKYRDRKCSCSRYAV